jgi:hypothetical protein
MNNLLSTYPPSDQQHYSNNTSGGHLGARVKHSVSSEKSMAGRIAEVENADQITQAMAFGSAACLQLLVYPTFSDLSTCLGGRTLTVISTIKGG